MRQPIIVLLLFLFCLPVFGLHATEEKTPKYLYKILSVENWYASQNNRFIKLSPEDSNFIHLAREDQLPAIIAKYWAKVPEFVVLKLPARRLPGRLVYEANPGGTNKYYHLYYGTIPLRLIAEVKLVRNNPQKSEAN